MRDIAIALIVAYCCAVSLKKPYTGFLCWIWLSLMNPHKISYGFIVSAPVALVTMLAVLTGTLLYQNKAKLFQSGLVGLQMCFLAWTAITTIFAIFPEHSMVGLDKFSKIMLGVFISYLLVDSRKKLDLLVLVIFLSVGFYGIKGGIFTLRSGGGDRVWGPDGSFIGDNNHLACALLMVMPLGAYLMSIEANKLIKRCYIGSMALIGVSVLGSNSRGAFLGLGAVLLFWLRKAPGKQKVMVVLIGAFIGAIALLFMPASFWERMNTIKTYEEDGSAMGRINAWWCAFNLASDRFTGAGFDYATPFVFRLYAPNPLDLHTAHSIYFQSLGDHGFVGLGLFLWHAWWTWGMLGKTIKKTERMPDLAWANLLARMMQLSLVAYFVAAAFLSLPYYDLYWQLAAISVILHTLVVKSLETLPQEAQLAAKLEKPGKPSFVRLVGSS